MKNLLVHAWSITKFEEKYYIPFTHWVYLHEMFQQFESITLISPTRVITERAPNGLVELSFSNLSVVELGYSRGYISAIKNFFQYVNAYRNAKDYSVSYVRFPVPFGWLQKVFLRQTKRIIHFVGDPIDATRNNPNFNSFRKRLLVLFFLPEYFLYLWACRGAKVFTNGRHLSEKLRRQGVRAIPLVSSTLRESDFFIDIDKKISNDAPKILYVGYLRRAKGVETLIKALKLVQAESPDASLTIVGTGDFETELKRLIRSENISNVDFLGHVDDRALLNSIFRHHDIFCFGSLSEGSPRVVLEAMANGINVISTPVGSLPSIFESGKSIIFVKQNSAEGFRDAIFEVLNDPHIRTQLRRNAYRITKRFTIKRFIGNIFSDEA